MRRNFPFRWPRAAPLASSAFTFPPDSSYPRHTASALRNFGDRSDSLLPPTNPFWPPPHTVACHPALCSLLIQFKMNGENSHPLLSMGVGGGSVTGPWLCWGWEREREKKAILILLATLTNYWNLLSFSSSSLSLSYWERRESGKAKKVFVFGEANFFSLLLFYFRFLNEREQKNESWLKWVFFLVCVCKLHGWDEVSRLWWCGVWGVLRFVLRKFQF
jgi:hypothetical protein